MRWGKSVVLLLGAVLSVWLGSAYGSQQTHPKADNAKAAEQRILVLGDSLSAEYGLPRGTGWVTLIEQRLAASDKAYQIRNASISGDTTISGLQRLPAALAQFDPDLVIIQLGANDGLRGLPVSDMKENLRKMIELSQSAGARVLVLGQHVPPNYGARYARQFHEVFGDLAKETGVALVPFMLEGIATDPDMFQSDGLHPTDTAQPKIAETIWPHIERLLN